MAARQPVHQQYDDVKDPDVPADHQNPVDPHEPGAQAAPEGMSTLAGIFGQATVVDEVQELPMQMQTASPGGVPAFWVIRPNQDIEDMTLGVPIVHLAFKAGTRYKVPRDIAYELCRLDYLIEMPFPYDDLATGGRR